MTEAYRNGFCKAASDYGVDPAELMKIAQLGAVRGVMNAFKGIKGMSNVGRGLGQIGRGIGGAASNAGRMAQGLGEIGVGIGRMGYGLGQAGAKAVKPVMQGLGRMGRNLGSGLMRGAERGFESVRATSPFVRNTRAGVYKGLRGLGDMAGTGAQKAMRALKPAFQDLYPVNQQIGKSILQVGKTMGKQVRPIGREVARYAKKHPFVTGGLAGGATYNALNNKNN